MSWSVDGQSIIDYPPGSDPSVNRYESTDIYSVLLSNDNNVLLSELIFMVCPNPPSFLVECFGSGLNFASRNITVIANNSIPAPGNMGHSVSGLTVTLFWNHDRADVIQFFEIMLNGNLHAVAKGSQTQIEIQLPECREFIVLIVAVDFCNNRNMSELFNVSCQVNTTQCNDTTDSLLMVIESEVKEVKSEVKEVKSGVKGVESGVKEVESEVNEVTKIVISFVLLHLVIYVLNVGVQIYQCVKAKRQQEKKKGTEEMNLQQHSPIQSD